MQETQETWVQSLGREDPLEEGMATHSSILAWKIPWTEELGGLQSMGSQESDATEHTYRLSIYVFQNSHVKISPPMCYVEVGHFADNCHKGKALLKGISVLRKDPQRDPLPLSPLEDTARWPFVNQDGGSHQTANLLVT